MVCRLSVWRPVAGVLGLKVVDPREGAADVMRDDAQEDGVALADLAGDGVHERFAGGSDDEGFDERREAAFERAQGIAASRTPQLGH